MAVLIDVVLPLRLPLILTYEASDSDSINPGKRVLVPLGNKEVIGCVLRPASMPPKGIKKIIVVLDEEPILTPTQLKLLVWASQYYLTPIGEVLRHLLPPSLLQPKKKTARKIRPLPQHQEFSPGRSIQLNLEQEAAVQKILATHPAHSLLQGVTGSGKTEIYIQLARSFLKKGGQVLILVPEIALTPQLIGRFEEALAQPVIPYHSGLTEAQRLQVWLQVRSGQAPLIVGTRSAIFLPFTQLELIVVDEEHDSSYKQEERFCYHARDLALWRGKEEGASVLLGSATPSLESIYRCRRGKMERIVLSSRPAGTALPAVQLVDRRIKSQQHHFSEALLDALKTNLKTGEQSLVFLNRRGFAPFLICPSCGHIPTCQGCDISFTYHKKIAGLLCHYCDRNQPIPSLCPSCHTSPLRPEGIGTERIESELQRHFPKARIARLDRDSGAGEKMFQILSRMKRREVDILIGTQTITKGHDFPALTLVGIVDADTALSLPDFRATERTFQLLTQVAGRSGRGDKAGKVVIQTYHPDHPALLAAVGQDGHEFMDAELNHREAANYPPFCRLIRMIFSGQKASQVETAAQRVARHLAQLPAFKSSAPEAFLLGPSPCPMARIRNKSRWHLLIKSRQFSKLHPMLQPFLDGIYRNGLPSGVRLMVNVDPVDMM